MYSLKELWAIERSHILTGWCCMYCETSVGANRWSSIAIVTKRTNIVQKIFRFFAHLSWNSLKSSWLFCLLFLIFHLWFYCLINCFSHIANFPDLVKTFKKKLWRNIKNEKILNTEQWSISQIYIFFYKMDWYWRKSWFKLKNHAKCIVKTQKKIDNW